jgi:hypothetical protein
MFAILRLFPIKRTFLFFSIILAVILFSETKSAIGISDEIKVSQNVTAQGGGEIQVPPPTPIHSSNILNILELSVDEISLNSATIKWKTDYNALCKLFWGTTIDYERESISETNYSMDHSIKLENLFPKSLYHFKISCVSEIWGIKETEDQMFSTIIPQDTTPPANVSDLEAIPKDREILLKWKNPGDSDFGGVRIVKNEKFYPTDIFDGDVVYIGSGESFIDKEVENWKKYYYTVYSFDKNGNYSSGAVVFSIPNPEGKPITELPFEMQEVKVPVPPEIEKITIDDFDIFINGEKIILDGNAIKANANDRITVSLKYEKVPEVLKTIMITLEKDEKFFSFLLRINRDKTAYEAGIIAPPQGNYSFIISIFDYKNQILKKIKGSLLIKALIGGLEPERNTFDIFLYKFREYAIYIFLLIIIVAIWAGRRKFKDNSKIREQNYRIAKTNF